MSKNPNHEILLVLRIKAYKQITRQTAHQDLAFREEFLARRRTKRKQEKARDREEGEEIKGESLKSRKSTDSSNDTETQGRESSPEVNLNS